MYCIDYQYEIQMIDFGFLSNSGPFKPKKGSSPMTFNQRQLQKSSFSFISFIYETNNYK